jgi:hypothetical protein
MWSNRYEWDLRLTLLYVGSMLSFVLCASAFYEALTLSPMFIGPALGMGISHAFFNQEMVDRLTGKSA